MADRKLKLVFVDGDVATGSGGVGSLVYLRPPVGLQWDVIEAFGFHNDTTSREFYWQYNSYNNAIIQKGRNTLATNIRCPINAHILADGNSIMHPLVLRRELYAAFGTDANMTSGKQAKVRALVWESVYDDDT